MPLHGVRAAAIICHGGSSVRAIKNAVPVTQDFVRNRVNDRIHDEILRMTASRGVGGGIQAASDMNLGSLDDAR